MKKKFLKSIEKGLKKRIERKYKKDVQRFFKEEVKVYGVRIPQVRQIARAYFPLVSQLKKEDVFKICQSFLETGYEEKVIIALDWLYRLKHEFKKSDFKVFEFWLKKYISNWGTCDDFCTHALGYLIFSFPDLIPRVKKWTRSRNRWLRRAAAVALIYSIRRKKYLSHVFETADLLLKDRDDLVQKGYGWLLKEASNLYQKQVFDFVMKRKQEMPRTALRYAIEKMPEDLRKRAMAR